MEEGEQVSTKKDPFAALRYSEFRSYLGMRFFFTFAYQMQAVIIGYYIYQQTKDAFALGMIGLVEAIPSIGIALYGGYVADKSEKKKLLIKIFAVMWVCSTVMLLVTLPQAHQYVSSSLALIIIYLMIFCIGLARGFYGPTAFSVMTHIIPRELYPNSSTWNSSAYQTASVIGPMVGGLIFAYAGITSTFVVVVVFITIALIAISLLKRHPAEYVPKESIYHSLSEGINFVFKTRMMLGALSLDLFSVLFGGVVAVLPIFANDILKVGAEGFGLMRSIDSIGAVLTMLVMTRYSPMGKPWRNLLIAVTGFGISIICFGLSRSFYWSLFFLFTLGAFDSISVLIRSTIMQVLTPDKMRGRVSAVNSMFIGSSNEIGAFESGLTAKYMGAIPSVLFGGSMTLIVVVTTWLKTRKLVPLTLDEINAPKD
ncbi:MFS transporter [Mucilaginibacter paludis]|uniref:Major facilitator superfamily MFS_1 n=1 Tax=Mucilaginibacter paludis DSM 18603 TaxID=714943 RepID=H1Y2U1_9SPHI|nr:MFS transporter [Mucilaginibacter paludis]EHQ28270.1 major facilitator superfamily MFS_1 [Mucilaginibacter paludis DSM 18603]